MKLADRVVVEPLADERMTNIERRVVARAADAAARGRRAPRRWYGLLVAGAMAAAALAGWVLRPPQVATTIAEAPPVRVQTTARAVLDIGDARIESARDTAFTVTRPAGGVLVEMTSGRVALEVGKRGGRPPLVVRAGDTDVVVVGTQFSVGLAASGVVDVQVTEGAVRVVHQQQETRVAAGHGWRADTGLVALADATAPPSRDDRATQPVAAPTTAPAAQTIAAQVTPPTAPASVALHGRTAATPEASPIVERPGSTSQPAIAAKPGASAKPARLGTARPELAARPADPLAELHAAIRGQRVEPALDLGEPDADQAIARYYDLAAHRSGDEASQAFYSIAVVKHLRLGRNAEAMQALDGYVRRFPGGKHYRAALWLRIRILCSGKIDDRCRAAAYTFVHEAGDDPAARTAERITLSD